MPGNVLSTGDTHSLCSQGAHSQLLMRDTHDRAGGVDRGCSVISHGEHLPSLGIQGRVPGKGH